MQITHFQHLRGSSNLVDNYAGPAGEIVVDLTNKQLRIQDGSTMGGITVPSATPATTATAGMMTAADKVKLNGIEAGANAYVLPTASTTLGGVKTTSNVLGTDGLIACPIIEGVVYYSVNAYTAGTGLTLSGKQFSVASTAGTSALAWNSEVTLGTVGGLAIKAKLPANPNTDTWVAFIGATSEANGTAGYVSAPGKGNQLKFFRGDGTWVVPTDTTYTAGAGLALTGTVFSVTSAAGTSTLAWNSEVTLCTVAGVQIKAKLPANPNTDTHWVSKLIAGVSGSTGNATATNGNLHLRLFDDTVVRSDLVLAGSGATSVTSDASGNITIHSTDTTYSTFKASGSNHAGGLVPDPGETAGATKYLREDGTWAVPPDTKYNAAEVAPLVAAGTAAVGSSVKYAREDHVHPVQTSVSGNAGTASKLATAQSLKVALGSTTAVTFDGSAAQNAIPVSGVLAVANGGTGQSAIADIRAGKDGAGNTITATYATKTELADLAKGAYQVVESLPVNGTEGVLYLIETTSGSNVYNRYIWENDAFVPMGMTQIDLTNYSTKPNTISALAISGKSITYTKGDGSTGTLTTQDTTYSAGTGLSLSGTTFSVTNAAGTSTLSWNTEVTLCTIAGVAVKAKLPANPNTNTWTAFVGASASVDGTAGYVPAPGKGNQGLFFRGDGTWAAPANTTYSAGTGLSLSGTTFSVTNTAGTSTLAWNTEVTLCTIAGVDVKAKLPANPNTNTTYSAGTGLSLSGTTFNLSTAGSALGGVKTTSTVTSNSGYTACPIIDGVVYYKDTDTTYTLSSLGIGNVKNYDQSKAIKSITRSGTTFTYTCLDGTTGTFTQQDNNTTYSNFVKSGSGAAAGLVPAPSTTAGTTKYLREDGTWAVPPDNNTTYSVFTGASSSAAGSTGLVPAPAAGDQAKFLRADKTWGVPTNTTYSVATTSANGLMSSSDKSKLDGIASGANAYSLPAAGSALGGVKTTSTVTSNSGYTACPIIAGVVYYKDTNTTYSNFGASGTNHKAGLVPDPGATAGTTKYLREDGSWQVPPDNNTTYSNFGASGKNHKAGLVPDPGATAGTTKYLREDGSWQVPPNTDTNTHYTTTLKVGATGVNSNAVTTNGNTYLKVVDDSTVRSNIKIVGSGAATVTSDANGVITISSTDTNTNTTYSAGNGLALSGTTFSCSFAPYVKSANIGNTAYADVVQVNASDKSTSNTPNRVGTIRITNNDGENICLIGVHDEVNGPPKGLVVRNAAGTLSGKLEGIFEVATPAAASNTTETATTAWVRTYCETTKKFLTAHQSLSNYLTKTTNVSEMGRYIDLHYDNATSKYDYDARIYVDSQGTAAGGGELKITAAKVTATTFNGTASKVANALVLKINSGSTEGTNLYTFNGSAAKTLNIKAGSNVTLTAGSGTLTIAATNTTYSFSDKNVTLAWGTKSTIATVGGTDIHVTMPANPNTNTDTLVTQNVSTTNAKYPILCCPTAAAADNQGAKTAIFGSKVRVNPYAGSVLAKLIEVLGTNETSSEPRIQIRPDKLYLIYDNTHEAILSCDSSGRFTVSTTMKAYGSIHASSSTYKRTATKPTFTDTKWATITVQDSTQESALGGMWHGVYGSTDYKAVLGLRCYSANSGQTDYAGLFVSNSWDGTQEVYTGNNTASFKPTKNTTKLGENVTANKWAEIWCVKSSINTASDERIKSFISPIDDAVLDAWGDVNWIKFKYNDAIEEKKDKARFHNGVIAQQVQKVFSARNIDITRYGLFLYDEWEAKPAEIDENGHVMVDAIEAGDMYGIAYTEALCMEAAYQRRRADRLEAKLTALEERLAALEAKLS